VRERDALPYAFSCLPLALLQVLVRKQAQNLLDAFQVNVVL